MGRSAKVAVAGPGWSVADVPGPRAGTGTGTMRRRAVMSPCPASVAGALVTVHYLGASPVARCFNGGTISTGEVMVVSKRLRRSVRRPWQRPKRMMG